MFGVMGLGSAFMNAACAKGGSKRENVFLVELSVASPTIPSVSCVGEITVKSTYQGSEVIQSYTDLNSASLSIQADANTEIVITGDLTRFSTYTQYPAVTKITKLNALDCQTLATLIITANDQIEEFILPDKGSIVYLDCDTCGLEELDVSKQINMTTLKCDTNNHLTELNLASNSLLSSLSCSGCTGLTTIKYPATNSDVATAIAAAITAATAADGTVYTDSAGAYYRTIADAATAKGWTIEQLS